MRKEHDHVGRVVAREPWIRYYAMHIAEQLPDKPEYALAVLDEAARLVQEFLGGSPCAMARVCGRAGACCSYSEPDAPSPPPLDLASRARLEREGAAGNVIKFKR